MIYMIVNPIAGRGRALQWERRLSQRLTELGSQYRVLYTQYAGHAKELAQQAVREGASCVAMISGDGTLQSMAEGLKDTGVPVCILPGGTGNDVSRALGMPKTPEEAADVIIAGHRRRMDVGSVNGRCFLNIVGVGFDVDIVRYAEKTKRYMRGLLNYLVALIRALAHHHGHRMRVIADGVERNFEAVIVAVANGRYFGGGMMVAPNADPTDGLLDVCMIQNVSRLRALTLLPKFITGKHIEMSITEYIRAKHVVIEQDRDKIQADGDIVQARRIEILLDGALEVLVPVHS